MRRYILFLIVCLFLINGFISDAGADLIISYRLENSKGMNIPATSSMKISLSSDAMRLDYTGLPYSMIYRKDGSFLLIDHKERSFWDMRDMMKEMERMKKEMERELARVPPEQRGIVEGMMKSQMRWLQGGLEEVEPCEDPRVIKNEMINNIPTKVVDGCKTIENGRWITCRYWFADGERLGLKADDFKIIVEFMEMQRKVFSSFGQMGQMMGLSFSYQPSARLVKLPYKLPFVVKGASVRNGKETGRIILEDIKRIKKLPEENFLPPEGYRKMKISEFLPPFSRLFLIPFVSNNRV